MSYKFYGREDTKNPFSGGLAGSFSNNFGPGVWWDEMKGWANVPYPACIDINDDGKLDVLVGFGTCVTFVFDCVSLQLPFSRAHKSKHTCV